MRWFRQRTSRSARSVGSKHRDRREVVLGTIDQTGAGLEIGPCHRPIAPKAQGFNVRILDHCSRDGLVEKYRGNPDVDPGVIEEVDYIWTGQPYEELMGVHTKFDWIIASHVIEHTPDLIGFLAQCESILSIGGALALVVPDKRYCFDRFRPLASLAQIVDASIERRTRHSPGVAVDYYMNVVRRSGIIAWHPDHRGPCTQMHVSSDALRGMKVLQEPGTYLDLHAWCFTPSWFRVIMHDLHTLGFTSLRESSFSPTQGHEFYVTLRRDGAGPDASRMDLLESALAELAVGSS
jgi:hypothetical protein